MGMHGRSWTEFYILITNCPNIATSLANIATSFVGMKDVAMLAKDVAMLGRTLLHVKSLITTENWFVYSQFGLFASLNQKYPIHSLILDICYWPSGPKW